MADVRLGSKAAVGTPALTDVHTITQGGVDYSETNTQIKTLICSDTTDSTTKDTGGFILEGGLGVEKNIVNGGYLKSSLGRWPINHIEGIITTNVIYDALGPCVPNVNDEIVIHGAMKLSGELFVFSYAKRYDSDTLYLYGIYITSGSTHISVSDGGSTSYDVSISW